MKSAITCAFPAHLARVLAAVAAAAALTGCVTLTVEPRALLLDSEGKVEVQSLACSGPASVARRSGGAARAEALDSNAIRLLTWNVHKQADPGWDRDLARFVAGNDIVLLQEAVLDPALRRVIETGGLRWVMASSFLYSDMDIGVVTGSRKIPLTSCTQRVVEPLIWIPKSAVITWFRLAGREDTLAVVNVHAINFALLLSGYRAQLEALGQALEDHPGPIIFAGDLNTWTESRNHVMRGVAARLGLTEIAFKEDRRSRFLGQHVDHIYVRGLDLVDAEAISVKSSDHNPLRTTFRIAATQLLNGRSTNPSGRSFAPTGTLRAAYIVTNLAQAKLDSGTGMVTGVVADITREVGRRAGVPVTITPLATAAAVLEAVKNGSADIGFVAPNPDRTGVVLYSQTYMLVQQSALVRTDSSLRSVSELDRKGQIIGINTDDSVGVWLRERLTAAHLRATPDYTLREAAQWLLDGTVVAFAGGRQRLASGTRNIQGLRLLDDNFYGVPQTIAVQLDRADRLQAVNAALDELRASGFLADSVARSGVDGLTVAPVDMPKR